MMVRIHQGQQKNMKYPNTIKVIFLDVDGVLNSHQYYEELERQVKNGQAQDGFDKLIDKDAVLRVKKICDETGAKIVISSTWRHGKLYDVLLDVFRSCDCEKFIIGKTLTKLSSEMPRGTEIASWIKNNIIKPSKYKNYVILDDDGDMLEDQMLNFIQTSSESGGLTDELTERTIRLLQSLQGESSECPN